MNFTPQSTDYAIAFHEKIENALHSRSIIANSYTSVELDTRRDFVKTVKALTDSFQNGYAPGSFTKFFFSMLPTWEAEVDHNNVHDFSVWISTEFGNNWGLSQDFMRAFNGFLNASYGSTLETIQNRLHRIEYGLTIKPSWATIFFNSSFYDSTFPLKWLNHFAARETFYLPHIISAFNKGYTPDVVRVTNQTVWSNLTPAETNMFLKTYSPRVLKQLMSLQTHGRQELTFELLMELAEVGFITAKEVRDYARKFGIGFTEHNFYNRIITAKEKFPVLDTYVPVI